MATMTYIKELQQLLKLHDKAVKQIIYIDEYIKTVSHQALMTAMNGHTAQSMHLLLRRSVAEGVKKMYKHYRLQTWFKAQVLVRDMTRTDVGSSLLDEDMSLPTDIFLRYPDLNRLSGTDTTAQTWSVMNCEFARFC